MFFGALIPSAAGLVGGLYLAIIEFITATLGPGPLPLLTLHHHTLLLSGANPDLEPVVRLSVALALVLAFTLIWLGLAALAVVPREFREGSA